jgi:hypothetical protein
MFSDPEAIAEDIIRDVGTKLVVGLPLGLGKANHIVNALYQRAVVDRWRNRARRAFSSAVSSSRSSTGCSVDIPIWIMPRRCTLARCRPM